MVSYIKRWLLHPLWGSAGWLGGLLGGSDHKEPVTFALLTPAFIQRDREPFSAGASAGLRAPVCF